MNTIGYDSEIEEPFDRRTLGTEDLTLTRSFFEELDDEDQISGRAIKSLHFLCPEVNESSPSVVMPEGIN